MPLRPLAWFLLLASAAAGAASAPGPAPAGSGPARLVRAGESAWRLERAGQPWELRGVGGTSHLGLAASVGATAIRTWGIDQLEPKAGEPGLLDRAAEAGLGVMAGIWVGHERHGFNYRDPASVARQRREIVEAVRRYKNHPAIVIWGLGNEAEGPTDDGTDPTVWRELEELAKLVRKEDPSRPICTVIAGAARTKLDSFRRHCPSIDILGVNAYGGAAGVGQAVVEAGVGKPFILAEFGPVGHWEVRATGWGAPIEPTSRDKAASYFGTHRAVTQAGAGRCLGTFAFLWGHKQETTSTWYGMFLASGEKLPPVDAMAYAWTGSFPPNRCPRIERAAVALAEARVRPGTEHVAEVEVHDREGGTLSYEWRVVEESTDRKVGGDREAAPPEVPGLVRGQGARVMVKAPARKGPYRLFLVVRDGQGGATADNWPFLVE